MENENSKISIFGRLKNGLEKTRNSVTKRINHVIGNFKAIDDDMFEELEEILITSDIGMLTTTKIIDKTKERVIKEKIKEPTEVLNIIKDVIIDFLGKDANLNNDVYPKVLVVIGVNGVGKTTTIGKIANKYKESGKKVLIAAADTFRAAAIEQLEVWGKKINVDIIKHQEGADPASVIYDAINSAKSKKIDVTICDTAGRLHNKKNLMEELKKIIRVIEKEYPEADKEVLLVLDATTGQNGIAQAKAFKEATGIDGIVLTKLDGTAKGGIVIAIREELGIPVKYIGIGEGIDDLQIFEPIEFVKALF